ncbi:hypothetical protein SPLC1_S500620 [Arthrospira platensis C1]|nr:hypothetical protein SPLC1_S500620 [Arthrospira platensis C1]
MPGLKNLTTGVIIVKSIRAFSKEDLTKNNFLPS